MRLHGTTSSLPRKPRASTFAFTRKQAMRVLKGTCVFALLTAGLVMKLTGEWDRLLVQGQESAVRMARDMGVAVRTVHITGVERADEAHLRQALGVRDGEALFDVNLDALRARAEEVAWVKSASISRRFPDLIDVKIEEHVPFAHWQVDGTLWLIDADGTPIVAGPHPDYLNLPFVVGSGAASEAKNLLDQLSLEPELMARMTSAIRVGGRRWDIRFDTGAVLSLPEDSDEYGLAEAWTRFAGLARDKNILTKAVETFDMRLKGRLVMKLSEGGRAVLANFEQAI